MPPTTAMYLWLRCASGRGQPDEEAGAVCVREQLDVAGHAAREPPGEREAEPGSVRPARLAEPATDARFEDALSLVVGDARTVVRDQVANGGVLPLDRH